MTDLSNVLRENRKTALVRAHVGIGGLLPGEVGELPEATVASAEKSGYVTRLDQLASRVKAATAETLAMIDNLGGSEDDSGEGAPDEADET